MKTPTEDHDWRLGPVDWSDYEVSPEDKIKVILNCQVRDWDIAMNFIRKKPTNLNSYILEDMKDQKVSINKAFSDIYDSVNDDERTEIFPIMHPIMKKIRTDYRNLCEALEQDVPLAVPKANGHDYIEDGHNVAAAPNIEPSLVEETLQPQNVVKGPLKEGGRTMKKRSRKKTTLSPRLKKPSPMITTKIQTMKFLMIKLILTRRMKTSRKKRIPNSFRSLKNPARTPQCRPFQGSIQPKAVYRSVPKLVPTCSSGQLRSRRRHQSYSSCYRQSNIESQEKRKDSTTNPAAAEPGDVTNVNKDEEKLVYLAPSEHYYASRANAVRSHLYHQPIT